MGGCNSVLIANAITNANYQVSTMNADLVRFNKGYIEITFDQTMEQNKYGQYQKQLDKFDHNNSKSEKTTFTMSFPENIVDFNDAIDLVYYLDQCINSNRNNYQIAARVITYCLQKYFRQIEIERLDFYSLLEQGQANIYLNQNIRIAVFKDHNNIKIEWIVNMEEVKKQYQIIEQKKIKEQTIMQQEIIPQVYKPNISRENTFVGQPVQFGQSQSIQMGQPQDSKISKR